MALNDHTATYAGGGPTLAAPTTSEVINAPDDNTGLLVTVGATATTITIVTPGTDSLGLARPDQSIGPLTNTTRLIRIDRNYIDANNQVGVTFSQVASVTASVVRL